MIYALALLAQGQCGLTYCPGQSMAGTAVARLGWWHHRAVNTLFKTALAYYRLGLPGWNPAGRWGLCFVGFEAGKGSGNGVTYHSLPGGRVLKLGKPPIVRVEPTMLLKMSGLKEIRLWV
jgi:hypothetical protein